MRWMVEIGRIDISIEVSLISSHLAYSQKGHLGGALHVMDCLKQKHNPRLVFDPTYPKIDESIFKDCDWKDFYGYVEEAIPPNAPNPCGKDVDLWATVDSDHAGDKETIQSRKGYLIFCNMSLVDCVSNNQPTFETSIFGAEFVVVKHVMKALRGIRYKLRIMYVPLSGCSYVYGDNLYVIHNIQRPESTLRNKSNSICYHTFCESVTMGETKTAHISTHDNSSELPAKELYGSKRKNVSATFCMTFMIDLFCLQIRIHCIWIKLEGTVFFAH